MGITDELERLQGLRERGALSEAEYQHAKARVLGAAPDTENGSDAGFGGPATPPGGGTHGHGGAFLRRLARSRTDRVFGGVCGGLGAHTELPAWAWRVIFCLVTLYFGAGLLFYLLLWIFLPLEPAAGS